MTPLTRSYFDYEELISERIFSTIRRRAPDIALYPAVAFVRVAGADEIRQWRLRGVHDPQTWRRHS